MGDPAVYVVVEGGQWRRTFSRHRSHQNDFDLLWGSQPMLARARNSYEMDAWTYPEALTYIDCDRGELRYCGGRWGDTGLSAAQHRVHHRLLEAAWPGWRVRYAWDGMIEVLDLIGVERGEFNFDDPRGVDATEVVERWSAQTELPLEWAEAVISVSRGDDVWLLPCYTGLFLVGPEVINLVTVRPAEPLSLPAVFDKGGMHIDVDAHRVDYWLLDEDRPLLSEAITMAWPGWTIEFHGWDCDDQTRRCRRRLHVDRPTQNAVIDGLITDIRERYRPYDELFDEHNNLQRRIGAAPVGSSELMLDDGRSWPWAPKVRDVFLSDLLHACGWKDAAVRHGLPRSSE